MNIQTDFQKAVYNCGDKFSENYTSQSRKQLDDIYVAMDFTEKDIAFHEDNGMFMSMLNFYNDASAAKYYFIQLKNHLIQLYPSIDSNNQLKIFCQSLDEILSALRNSLHQSPENKNH